MKFRKFEGANFHSTHLTRYHTEIGAHMGRQATGGNRFSLDPRVLLCTLLDAKERIQRPGRHGTVADIALAAFDCTGPGAGRQVINLCASLLTDESEPSLVHGNHGRFTPAYGQLLAFGARLVARVEPFRCNECDPISWTDRPSLGELPFTGAAPADRCRYVLAALALAENAYGRDTTAVLRRVAGPTLKWRRPHASHNALTSDLSKQRWTTDGEHSEGPGNRLVDFTRGLLTARATLGIGKSSDTKHFRCVAERYATDLSDPECGVPDFRKNFAPRGLSQMTAILQDVLEHAPAFNDLGHYVDLIATRIGWPSGTEPPPSRMRSSTDRAPRDPPPSRHLTLQKNDGLADFLGATAGYGLYEATQLLFVNHSATPESHEFRALRDALIDELRLELSDEPRLVARAATSAHESLMRARKRHAQQASPWPEFLDWFDTHSSSTKFQSLPIPPAVWRVFFNGKEIAISARPAAGIATAAAPDNIPLPIDWFGPPSPRLEFRHGAGGYMVRLVDGPHGLRLRVLLRSRTELNPVSLGFAFRRLPRFRQADLLGYRLERPSEP